MADDIRDADIMDVIYVAQNLRQADRNELAAATLLDPIDMALTTFEDSPYCKVGTIHGEPFCLFGVAMPSLIFGGYGMPWMVGTPKLEANAKRFLRGSREVIEEMRGQANVLENWVDARNTTSINWLKWLGFRLDDPKPYGILQRPFHRFRLET